MGDELSFKAFEAAGWSSRAGTYDALMARATAFAIEPLLVDLAPGERLLDVGCGPGALVAAAAARGASAVGVDLAPGMIAEARRRHPQLSFECADAESLPFQDGAFDLGVGAFLVNHLPDPERAVRELRRVARRVALAAWGPEESVAFLALPALAVAGLGGVPDGPDGERYADPDRLAALVGGACETLSRSIVVPDLDALWDGIRGGTVRTAARLSAASEPDRLRARARLDSLAEPYRVASGYELPLQILVARG